MVNMNITNFWLPGPESRSVNVFSTSKFWMIFDVVFFKFYFEKHTFLFFLTCIEWLLTEIVNIWSDLVNILSKFIKLGAEIKYSTVQNWYAGDKDGSGGVLNLVT